MVRTDISRVDTLLQQLADSRATAIIEGHNEIDGRSLVAATTAWIEKLRRRQVNAGEVCAFIGEFGAQSIPLLLALMSMKAIAMPLTLSALPELERLLAIAGAQWLIRLDRDLNSSVEPVEKLGDLPHNQLIDQFRQLKHAGLIVFTSGSSGEPKGILHDFERVLGKFDKKRPGWRTILFLPIDHFGGINTLLGCLAHQGVGICLANRAPETVCAAIAATHAELLPTTPTFLNVLLASGLVSAYDLSSLRLITYGAEPMPQATLNRITAIFPQVKLKQTYGLSELGVLHSKSPDEKSLWLKVGGDGFESRVIDGVLHIRSQSNMIGYLNAPNPIDHDGWMSTGDLVEQRGDLVRFLGRTSEILNVGGQKVFPAEIEDILIAAPRVADATVFGVPHPLVGQAVCARVSLVAPEDPDAAVTRLRAHCREHLAKFKVPMRFEIVDVAAHVSNRNKKLRTMNKQANNE
ncbi:MAG: AMP-dependent synthetase [Acidobacteria bacterium]|nr:MAG: AMP-dependent synthetase [Acidobacteriota bacterium]